MTLFDYLLRGWNWNPVVLAVLAAAAAAYTAVFRRRGRYGPFAAALLLTAVGLLSPLNLLAEGVLFSAHMTQHILLLLLVPALLVLSTPRYFAPRLRAPRGPAVAASWLLGIGSMWFWHVPQLCDAAAASGSVHTLQVMSFIAAGTVFWWPILAPAPTQRLAPAAGIAYLFTACLGCTALGMILTLTPVEVCPIFRAPSSAPALWTSLRDQLTARRDQQIGGLLMWVPMCSVYVGAIVLELFRWLGEPATTAAAALPKGNA